MEAVITGENGERVGVNLRDNNDVEHVIEMEFDGDTKYHEQDGYADDPAKRTTDENEHVSQARRFAKWYVYRQRGYDTLAPDENPDRLVAAILALSELEREDSDELFGELRRRLLAQSGDIEELPPGVDPREETIVYRQDLYVQPDPTDAEPPLLEQYCAHLEDLDQSSLETILSTESESDLPTFEIEAVSEPYYAHDRGTALDVHGRTSPLDRTPDARIELLSYVFDDSMAFHFYLLWHLHAQIRDRFVLMGRTPPEPFQFTGFGTYDLMRRDVLCGIYDEYYLSDVDIDGWGPEAIEGDHAH